MKIWNKFTSKRGDVVIEPSHQLADSSIKVKELLKNNFNRLSLLKVKYARPKCHGNDSFLPLWLWVWNGLWEFSGKRTSSKYFHQKAKMKILLSSFFREELVKKNVLLIRKKLSQSSAHYPFHTSLYGRYKELVRWDSWLKTLPVTGIN